MDSIALKTQIPTSPAFVFDEVELQTTLNACQVLRAKNACKLLYSIKSLPFYPILDVIKPLVDGFSVSSLFEARLAAEVLAGGQGSLHLCTPGIRADEVKELTHLCSHISFNSLSQHQRFAEQVAPHCAVGLRVNPKLSFIKDDRYNPCRKFSKLGVDIDALWQDSAIDRVRGLHIHTLFAANSYQPLLQTLDKLTLFLGDKLGKLDWINLGGGYLLKEMTDHSPLLAAVAQLKNRYDVDVYIEPGNGLVGHCGYLVTTVIDSFVSEGKSIAVLDSSVNHHPEVFEYQIQASAIGHHVKGRFPVILAGSSCLAGDIFGEYRFDAPLQLGDRVIFERVGAYTLVKANRFNGYNLPDIYCHRATGITRVKHYTFEDYRQYWLGDTAS
ncbi:MAG: carboxynorspermidine decarboxylase [Methylovulum sp.]|jgi:carboxynorspermidine decarboxylase|nr:carboxynorspermidine decarboxylase [Methylovulum sp.]MCF7998166.1 carboxynorspermidine decarboxylase [Methylovulum sp.]